ncbi:MAG: response regulator transcription factor [Deltaproteobacteria bacterium]
MEKKGKILIIEDEPGFRRIYRDLLESEGYEVMEAGDGEKGYILAKEEKPDMLLLDIVVPTLNGFELLKRLRGDPATKELPVIIFSVLGDKETIKKGLELGANDYAVKGFYSPGEMMSKIRALLTKSDIRKHIPTYRLELHEGRADAAKFQHDLALTKLFDCPHCQSKLLIELMPDYSRTEGRWFIARLICPHCNRAF